MTTIVFPGQGSQYQGMARDFYDNFRVAKDIFNEVEEITEINIKDIVFENKEKLLDITKYTQLSIFTASIAIYEVFKQVFDTLDINFVLGHSLGEYTALVASKTLSLKDCIKLLKIRGDLMQNAYPENQSGMAAVLGLDFKIIESVIKEAQLNIEVANDNAPGQIVISGIVENLKNAENILHKNGAKKIIYLNVSAAFHSRIMNKAQEEMKKHLLLSNFNDSIFPVISNFSANANTDSNLILDNLSKQMSNMVRWTESIKYLEKMKETKIIEIGPGKVLTGLIKRISSNFKIFNINFVEDIKAFENVV